MDVIIKGMCIKNIDARMFLFNITSKYRGNVRCNMSVILECGYGVSLYFYVCIRKNKMKSFIYFFFLIVIDFLWVLIGEQSSFSWK